MRVWCAEQSKLCCDSKKSCRMLLTNAYETWLSPSYTRQSSRDPSPPLILGRSGTIGPIPQAKDDVASGGMYKRDLVGRSKKCIRGAYLHQRGWRLIDSDLQSLDMCIPGARGDSQATAFNRALQALERALSIQNPWAMVSPSDSETFALMRL